MAATLDRRSIEDIKPDDVRGFTRCHFFAGIAGWELALRWAGWPADRPVWTGSCPCQPFSSAGSVGEQMTLGTCGPCGADTRDEWVNPRGTVFCWCPPGTYTVGSPPSEFGRYGDEQIRDVVIEEGFWISKFELTVSENPRGKKPRASIATEKNHPLTMVNHDDARRMTQKTLTEAEQKAGSLPSDWEYSLPTEIEWEVAARAGGRSAYSFGDDVEALPRHANFGDRSYFETGDIFSQHAHRTFDDGVARLARVGRYAPNAWGFTTCTAMSASGASPAQSGEDPGSANHGVAVRHTAWCSRVGTNRTSSATGWSFAESERRHRRRTESLRRNPRVRKSENRPVLAPGGPLKKSFGAESASLGPTLRYQN